MDGDSLRDSEGSHLSPLDPVGYLIDELLVSFESHARACEVRQANLLSDSC